MNEYLVPLFDQCGRLYLQTDDPTGKSAITSSAAIATTSRSAPAPSTKSAPTAV
jgi:hypothetical protein